MALRPFSKPRPAVSAGSSLADSRRPHEVAVVGLLLLRVIPIHQRWNGVGHPAVASAASSTPNVWEAPPCACSCGQGLPCSGLPANPPVWDTWLLAAKVDPTALARPLWRDPFGSGGSIPANPSCRHRYAILHPATAGAV